jgi:hypothetical protein
VRGQTTSLGSSENQFIIIRNTPAQPVAMTQPGCWNANNP